MEYHIQQNILHDFDLSIILPFYRKLEAFRRTLPANAGYLSRNGIEVIIVMDEPSEEQALLHFIGQYTAIAWKVIVNDKPHAWRPPCKAQNVGIRNAAKKYVMLMDPESEFFSDVIYILSYMCRMYGSSFVTGEVAFTDFHFESSKQNLTGLELLPYGSILTEKEFLYNIQGYDESYTTWGGDDDNLRARLRYYGISQLHVPDAVLIHREDGNTDGHTSRYKKGNQNPVHNKKRSFFPDHYLANDENWGKEFCRIACQNV